VTGIGNSLFIAWSILICACGGEKLSYYLVNIQQYCQLAWKRSLTVCMRLKSSELLMKIVKFSAEGYVQVSTEKLQGKCIWIAMLLELTVGKIW